MLLNTKLVNVPPWLRALNTECAFEFELIVCVGCSNYVLVNVMAWFYFWVWLIFAHPYLWVVIIGRQRGLSGVSAASFAISECECGVYFQGCHGNHCICGGSDWCCRPSKTLLFLSWVNTWYTHSHTLRCTCRNTDENRQLHSHNAQKTSSVAVLVIYTVSEALCVTQACVHFPSLLSAEILMHLHHDDSSNRCPLNIPIPALCILCVRSAVQACFKCEVLTGGDRWC